MSQALVFGITLSVLGVGWALMIDLLFGIIVFAGLFFAVVVYTLWLKPRSAWNTVIGGAAGAVAPLIADAAVNGQVGAAGLLLFAEQPELVKPQFVIKAIRYPGNKIHANEYLDTEDFSGPLEKVFKDAMAFVMRNLHKVQAGRGVHAPAPL